MGNITGKYIFGIFACMAVVAVLILGAAYLWYPEAFSWKIALTAFVFFAVSVAGVFMIVHFAKKGERTLLSGYMAVRGMKMVALSIYLLVMLISDRSSGMWVGASFIIFYIAMLVFDTVYFSKKLKK